MPPTLSLAQGEVEVAQGRQVPVERRVEGAVGEVVATTQVQGLEIGHGVDELPEAFAEAEDLDFPDAPAHQGGEESGVGSPEWSLASQLFQTECRRHVRRDEGDGDDPGSGHTGGDVASGNTPAKGRLLEIGLASKRGKEAGACTNRRIYQHV